MKTRHSFVALILLVLLLLPFASLHASDAEVDLGPGVFFLRFLSLPDSTTLDVLLADQLPGGNEWKNAGRILTADQPVAQGSFFDTGELKWRGTLKELKVGRGYWVVLPDDSPAVHLVIANARVEAGVAPWSSPQGVLITTENGQTVIRPASPPRSTATYEFKKSTPTRTITASSGVYVQQAPQQTQSPVQVGGAQPISSGSGGGWVKVKLDSLKGYGGASEVWVPLAGQGTVTVPPPTDFDVAPWGTGSPPE